MILMASSSPRYLRAKRALKRAGKGTFQIYSKGNQQAHHGKTSRTRPLPLRIQNQKLRVHREARAFGSLGLQVSELREIIGISDKSHF